MWCKRVERRQLPRRMHRVSLGPIDWTQPFHNTLPPLTNQPHIVLHFPWFRQSAERLRQAGYLLPRGWRHCLNEQGQISIMFKYETSSPPPDQPFNEWLVATIRTCLLELLAQVIQREPDRYPPNTTAVDLLVLHPLMEVGLRELNHDCHIWCVLAHP